MKTNCPICKNELTVNGDVYTCAVHGSVTVKSMFKVVCAWCKDVMQDGDETNGISHGMCKPCADTMYAELNTMKG